MCGWRFRCKGLSCGSQFEGFRTEVGRLSREGPPSRPERKRALALGFNFTLGFADSGTSMTSSIASTASTTWRSWWLSAQAALSRETAWSLATPTPKKTFATKAGWLPVSVSLMGRTRLISRPSTRRFHSSETWLLRGTRRPETPESQVKEGTSLK